MPSSFARYIRAVHIVNAASVRLANKLPFLLSICSVLIGMGIGAMIPLGPAEDEVNPVRPSPLYANTRPLLEGGDEMRFILSTNLLVSCKMLLGLITCGMISIVMLMWTGMNISWAVHSALGSGIPLNTVAALILPHGIIELAGFLFFGSTGCEGLLLVCRKLKYDEWQVDSSRLNLNICRVLAGFFLISFASVLETFVTGLVSAKFN